MSLTVRSMVCAVDFSPFSALVVNCGISLARRAHLPLHLIHAVNDPQDRVHPDTLFERGGDLDQRRRKAQDQMAVLMGTAPVPWEPVVRFGDPVEETLRLVAKLPPGLVISASHGLSGFRRLIIGTVVERLVRRLDRPMLVVKPPEHKHQPAPPTFDRAVVACDHHGQWKDTKELLALVQTGAASQVHLVNTLEEPPTTAPDATDALPYDQQQQAQCEHLTGQLQREAQLLFDHAQQVAVTVESGVPHEMVLRLAGQQSTDLIAVGVRRRSRVGRWLSGSTTETVLRRALCSVLIVPETGPELAPAGEQT